MNYGSGQFKSPVEGKGGGPWHANREKNDQPKNGNGGDGGVWGVSPAKSYKIRRKLKSLRRGGRA